MRQLAVITAGFVILGPAGCKTITIAESAGSHGQVVDADSKRPVAGAKVCAKEPPDLCATTDSSGRFKIDPRVRTVWTFFMNESFSKTKTGEFTVNATGYADAEFKASVILSPVTVKVSKLQ
jgi:hypothetical protein